jgi:hypothetical protein
MASLYFHTSQLQLHSSHWVHTSRRRETLNLIRINPHIVNLAINVVRFSNTEEISSRLLFHSALALVRKGVRVR